MLRALHTWWIVITQIGDAMHLSRQVGALFRYFVLKTLDEEGLFKYLQQPHAYREILAEFGYVDGDYTEYLFSVLLADRQKILAQQDGSYRAEPGLVLPELESLVKQTSTQVRNFARMAQEMTGYIPARLRARPIEFEDTFEQEGRELLTSFDATLGSRIYSRLRTAGFAFLGRAAMDALRGKTLLEVGCGSGQATAELWARMQGDIHITATDSVAGMLELARQNFATLLDEVDPSHPPLTEANRPVFEEASATELPYEDGTFDAVWSAFVLHWTRDPRQAIAEILRVLKPGGVVFGLQPIKPLADPYFDLAVRSNESSYGFFWAEELRSWFARHEVQFAHTTPITVFRGYKPDHQGVSSSDVS